MSTMQSKKRKEKNQNPCFSISQSGFWIVYVWNYEEFVESLKWAIMVAEFAATLTSIEFQFHSTQACIRCLHLTHILLALIYWQKPRELRHISFWTEYFWNSWWVLCKAERFQQFKNYSFGLHCKMANHTYCHRHRRSFRLFTRFFIFFSSFVYFV